MQGRAGTRKEGKTTTKDKKETKKPIKCKWLQNKEKRTGIVLWDEMWLQDGEIKRKKDRKKALCATTLSKIMM